MNLPQQIINVIYIFESFLYVYLWFDNFLNYYCEMIFTVLLLFINNLKKYYGVFRQSDGKDNTITAKFFVMSDDFDPYTMDELIVSGRQKIVNENMNQKKYKARPHNNKYGVCCN